MRVVCVPVKRTSLLLEELKKICCTLASSLIETCSTIVFESQSFNVFVVQTDTTHLLSGEMARVWTYDRNNNNSKYTSIIPAIIQTFFICANVFSLFFTFTGQHAKGENCFIFYRLKPESVTNPVDANVDFDTCVSCSGIIYHWQLDSCNKNVIRCLIIVNC